MISGWPRLSASRAARFRDQLRVGDHSVYEAPFGRDARFYQLARQQHLHRMLASDCTRRATIGVEQNSPILTPGVAKLALSPATTRSQSPPVGIPRRSRSHARARSPAAEFFESSASTARTDRIRSGRTRGRDLQLAEVVARRNAGPLPAIITARASLRCRMATSASFSSVIIAVDSALRFSDGSS